VVDARAAGFERKRSTGGPFAIQRKDQLVKTSIDQLSPDPRNARRDSLRNIDQITRALREVGAAQSIGIDEDGVILAGNATVEAAKATGLTNVMVINADGETIVAVQRAGLTAKQKQRLALLDNRSAELAERDLAVITLMVDEIDLSDLWTADALGGAARPGTGSRIPRVQ
jgi:ParB-like chromosome segregation protein Spo0J